MQISRVQASLTQERMWTLAKLSPGNPYLHIPVAVDVKGLLERSALRDALATLTRRHETLRTVFDERGDTLTQTVWAEHEYQIAWSTLDAVGDIRRPGFGSELREWFRRPFDLEAAPPVRVSVFSRDARSHLLLLVFHHIVIDRWSARLFLAELGACYSAYVLGAEPALPPPHQYREFSQWQQRQLSSGGFADQERYWRRELKDVPTTLSLLEGRRLASAGQHEGARRRVVLSGATLERVRRSAAGLKSTPFGLFTAAMAVTLYRLSGQDDMAVGVPVAARTQREWEGVIGPFVNTVMLRLRIDAGQTLVQVVEQVNGRMYQALDNQDVPLSHVMHSSSLAPPRGETLPFQVLVQMTPGTSINLAGAEAGEIACDPGTAHCPLSLTIIGDVRSEVVVLELEHDRGVVDDDFASRTLARVNRVIECIVDAPWSLVGRVPVITDDERQLVMSWGRG